MCTGLIETVVNKSYHMLRSLRLHVSAPDFHICTIGNSQMLNLFSQLNRSH